MKPVAVVCFVSLVINVGLVGYIAWETHGAHRRVASNASAVAPVMSTGLSAETRRLLAQAGVDNLELLRDRLRAEAVPELVVQNLLEQRLWRDRQAKLDAADPVRKRPWWQQVRDPLPGDDVRMGRLEQQLRFDLQARMRQLFPEKNDSVIDPAASFLSVEKQRQVQKIRDDYRELEARLSMETGDAWVTNQDGVRLHYLRDEAEKDLRMLLTAQEYAELELRNPGEEPALKKAAALIGLSEREFRGLLAINKWFSEEGGKIIDPKDPFASVPPEKQELYNQLQVDMKKQERDILGAEKFDLYDKSNTADFDQIFRYVARFDLPPARISEYFKLNAKAMEAGCSISGNAALTDEQRSQAMSIWRRNSEAALTDLLGPAAMDSGLGLANLINQQSNTEY